jgi:hypothetical protein
MHGLSVYAASATRAALLGCSNALEDVLDVSSHCRLQPLWPAWLTLGMLWCCQTSAGTYVYRALCMLAVVDQSLLVGSESMNRQSRS